MSAVVHISVDGELLKELTIDRLDPVEEGSEVYTYRGHLRDAITRGERSATLVHNRNDGLDLLVADFLEDFDSDPNRIAVEHEDLPTLREASNTEVEAAPEVRHWLR